MVFVLGNYDMVESKPPGTELHYEQGTIDITAKQNDSAAGNLQDCCFAKSQMLQRLNSTHC